MENDFARKNESRKVFWQETREINRVNRLENNAAWHQDCITMQGKRQKLTEIWFPNIAEKEWYKTYVQHNVQRHQRAINKALDEIDREVYTPVDR